MAFECRPVIEFQVTVRTLWHARYRMLFRFVIDVHPICLDLPMPECLMLAEGLFCG